MKTTATTREFPIPTHEELMKLSELPGLQELLLSNTTLLESLLATWSETLAKDDFLQLVITIGDCYKQRGDLSRAEGMYTLGLAQKGSDCQLNLVGEAFMQRGDVYSRQGRWRDASADLDQSRKIYKQLNELVALGRAENILGINYAVRGKTKRAKTYIKRALQSFEQFEETLLSGIAQMNLGVVHSLLGDYDGALSSYHRARSHFEEAGDLARLAEIHHKCGMAFLEKRVYDEALREFELTASFSAKCNTLRFTGLAKLGKANVYYQLGDLQAALSLANQSLDSFSIHDDRLNLADVYLLKGKIHREMKKNEFAEWYVQTSLKINLAIENQFSVGECYYQLGILHKLCSKLRESRRAFEKSLECFASIGAIHDVKRVRAELRSIRGKSGDEIRRTRQQKS